MIKLSTISKTIGFAAFAGAVLLANSAAAAPLPLFPFAPPPAAEVPTPSAAEAALAALDPDALSPREALDALYALRKLLG